MGFGGMKDGFKTYENLEIWIEFRKLVSDVYLISKVLPKRRTIWSNKSNQKSSYFYTKQILKKEQDETILKINYSFSILAEDHCLKLKHKPTLAFDQSYLTEGRLKIIRQQI